jgi:hypothetical protein
MGERRYWVTDKIALRAGRAKRSAVTIRFQEQEILACKVVAGLESGCM